MRKIFALIFVALFLQAGAQDENLLNPMQSLISVNPSFAGSNGSVRGQFIARNQWPQYSVRRISSYNSIDGYVKQVHGGLAVSGLFTQQGLTNNKSAELHVIYAPVFTLKNKKINIIPSLQLSYIQFSSPGNNFFLPQTGTPSQAYPAFKSNADFSSGILFNYKGLYLGASVFHITQPDIGLYGPRALRRRINLNVSYNRALGKSCLLNLSLVNSSQSFYNYTMLTGNLLLFRHYLLGVGYIDRDATFMNIGYRNNLLSVSAGYEVVVSRLAEVHNVTSYQVALSLRLPKKEKPETPECFEKW